MPIKPENKSRYPANWSTEIRPRILQRAGNRCEQCGLLNHAWGWRDKAGIFHRIGKDSVREMFPTEERYKKRPPFLLGVAGFGMVKVIEIVLTIAHLDHVPEHCDDDNLQAMCQRCHLRYDQQHHLESAAKERRKGRALDDLFPACEAKA